jgi:hypothetical protein
MGLMNVRFTLASIFVLTGVALGACGTDGESNFTDDAGASGASGGTSGGFGASGGASSGASGGASSGASGQNGCSTTSKKAEKQPVDMVIGLDTSFSMDFDDKWINVREALRSFVGNPNYTDLGVGLQFFPLRKQCSVPDYQSLAVPLALQPDARGPIDDQLAAQRMAGGTPMVPLLQGLSAYLAANAKPGRKPVIVLATDGFPDDTCLSSEDGATPNTLDNAVAVAKAALAATPSVATFVIGVGGELDALDAIAAAGGTTKATLVDTSVNARAQFLAALENIRKTAIPCDYDIPSGAIDPSQTNVTYTTGGTVRQMVYTANEAGCAKAQNGEGWYFDNEAAPKKVILCAAVCNVVKQDDQGSVDLVFGCPRNDVK